MVTPGVTGEKGMCGRAGDPAGSRTMPCQRCRQRGRTMSARRPRREGDVLARCRSGRQSQMDGPSGAAHTDIRVIRWLFTWHLLRRSVVIGNGNESAGVLLGAPRRNSAWCVGHAALPRRWTLPARQEHNSASTLGSQAVIPRFCAVVARIIGAGSRLRAQSVGRLYQLSGPRACAVVGPEWESDGNQCLLLLVTARTFRRPASRPGFVTRSSRAERREESQCAARSG